MAVCNGIAFKIAKAGLESGTARSAGHRFTVLPRLLFGETEDGSI